MDKETIVETLKDIKRSINNHKICFRNREYYEKINSLINDMTEDLALEKLWESEEYKTLTKSDNFHKDKFINVCVHEGDYYEVFVSNYCSKKNLTKHCCQGLDATYDLVSKEVASSERAILKISSNETFKNKYERPSIKVTDRLFDVYERFMKLPNAMGDEPFSMIQDDGDICKIRLCGSVKITNVDYKKYVVNNAKSRELLKGEDTISIIPKELVTVGNFKEYKNIASKDLMFMPHYSNTLHIKVDLGTDDGELNDYSIIGKFVIKRNDCYSRKYVEDFLASVGTYGVEE